MKSGKILSAVCVSVLVLMLTACAGMTAQEAEQYVQAVLDAGYKADFDAYTEQTESTKEEAWQLYNENIDTAMETGGIIDADLPEELTGCYRQLLRSTLAKADYEVEEACREDGGAFAVTVGIRPFTAFRGLEEEVTEAVEAELDHVTDPSGMPDEAQMNELVYRSMYEVLAERIKNPGYGKRQEVKLHVQPDEKHTYYIPQAELAALDRALFPSEDI